MSETLATLAVALAILLTYRFIRSPTPSTAAWVGVAIGLAMLARAELGLLLPLMVLPVALMLKALPRHAPAPAVPAHVRGVARGGEPVADREPHPLRRAGAVLHQRRPHACAAPTCRRTWYGEGTGVWALDCAGYPGAGRPLGGVERRCAREGLDFISDHLVAAPRGRRGARGARVEPVRAGVHGQLQRERGPRRRGVVGRVLRVLGAGAVRGRRRRAAAPPARADHAAGRRSS